MKKLALLASAAAVSALLVAGLSGCVTINTTAPSNSSGSVSSASASSAATNTNSSSSAASNTGKSSSSATSNTSSTSNTSYNTSITNTSKPADTVKYGSAKVGYVDVPTDWKDFTDKLDSRMVDSTGAVLVVDPTTEFTSGVESHFAWADSIKMETFPCAYTEKADEVLYDYRGDTGNYANVTIEKDKFCGRDASIVKCESADGVNITNIVFDKDGSGHACNMMTIWATPSAENDVLKYARSWKEN